MVKSNKGLGFTIVGGDDIKGNDFRAYDSKGNDVRGNDVRAYDVKGNDAVEEFLQIKSVIPNGPAWNDGRLQTGEFLFLFYFIRLVSYVEQLDGR